MKTTVTRLPDGRIRVEIPLPPSTNARLGVNDAGRKVKTPEARDYMTGVATALLWASKGVSRVPIRYWTWVDVWVVMPKTNCDNHNYFKIAFDTIEEAGLAENDKYIMPNLRGIGFDAKAPTMVLEWAA